jgi:hypothetical protein
MRQLSKDAKKRQNAEKFKIKQEKKRKNLLIKKLMLEIFQRNI